MNAPETVDSPAGTLDHNGLEPSKRERNKAEKRRRIIEAAAQLFREQGFEATTTAEISAAAGVGTGTLYLYIDSKEDLLVDVFLDSMRGIWADACQQAAGSVTLADELIEVFSFVTRYHLGEPLLSRAIFKEMVFSTGTVRHRARTIYVELHDRLIQILERAQADGRLVTGVDLDVLADNIYSAWHFAMQRRVARGGDDDLRDEIERSIRTALFGLT